MFFGVFFHNIDKKYSKKFCPTEKVFTNGNRTRTPGQEHFKLATSIKFGLKLQCVPFKSNYFQSLHLRSYFTMLLCQHPFGHVG